jgi:hypothetical protein
MTLNSLRENSQSNDVRRESNSHISKILTSFLKVVASFQPILTHPPSVAVMKGTHLSAPVSTTARHPMALQGAKPQARVSKPNAHHHDPANELTISVKDWKSYI